MILLPLASISEAAAFGLTVTDAALYDASARVREYVRQDFAAGTFTVDARGERLRLPHRPVSGVVSVADEDGNLLDPSRYRLRPGGYLEVPGWTGWLAVTYTSSGDVPAGLARVVCQVASRIMAQPAGLAAGAQQQSAGPFQQTFGWDSHVGSSGLTAGERRSLDRLFPRGGRGPIVMRPA